MTHEHILHVSPNDVFDKSCYIVFALVIRKHPVDKVDVGQQSLKSAICIVCYTNFVKA